MAYSINWAPKGAVKYYSGDVTFEDVYRSESEIQISPEFDNLRYVISVFEGNEGVKLSKSEGDLMVALRLGAMNSNPRLKYAYVSTHDNVRIQVEESIKLSHSAYPIKVFDNLRDALDWAMN